MPTVTIGDNTGTDFSGTEDTQLRSASATTNFGSSADLGCFSWAVSDDGTFAIRFTGLSNISGPVTVSAAEVRFYLTSQIGDDAKPMEAHRLLRNWVEAQATADIYSTGNSWQTQLGVGANDISGTVSATLNVGVATGQYYVWSSAQLATDVENWINGVNVNHGWLLKPETFDHGTQAHIFDSSEGTNGQRPLLVITYAAAGSTYTLTADPGSVAITGTAAALRAARKLIASAGSVALTGTDATLIYDAAGGSVTLPADSGAFTISGTAAALRTARTLTATAGSFSISGTAAALSATRRLTATFGSVLITGTAADLISTGTVVIFERYVRAESAPTTLTDDLLSTSPATTLTTALAPTFPRVP